MLQDRKLVDLLELMSSKKPAPGGGTVAALSGALACSMVSMVCNLTIGKKKYIDVQDEIENILTQSEEIRAHFQELMEQDTEAFNDVMGAFRMPKSTEEEKAIRKEAIHHALQKATYVPLRTMEYGAKVLKLANRVAAIGNKNVVSDAGVAALMAESAMHSGWLNVAININSIEDTDFVDRISEKVEGYLDDADGLTDETLEIVEDTIYS